jgi:hypothetical protein
LYRYATMDEAMCARKGDTSHVFVARLIGPGDAEAFSKPMGDGVYLISLVPPAPGSYQLELGGAVVQVESNCPIA